MRAPWFAKYKYVVLPRIIWVSLLTVIFQGETSFLSYLNMVHLPNEIWSRVLHWLSPLDRQSFKLIAKHASGILTSSQIKNSGIWAKIFYNNRAAHRALEHGVDLALIGRIHDIGNKQAEKPYLFLVTIPTNATPWQQQEAEILPFVRGKMERDWGTGANSFDFPEFTVNIGGIYNHGRGIPLPAAHLSQFADENTCVLYYSRDCSLDVSSKRFNAPHGYGQDIYIKLEDGESVRLRCPTLLS